MYHKHTNKCCISLLESHNKYHIATLGLDDATIIPCYTLTDYELH